MDILGAGGFLLSNYQPELAEYFEDGKEVVMYHSRADLVEKVQNLEDLIEAFKDGVIKEEY